MMLAVIWFADMLSSDVDIPGFLYLILIIIYFMFHSLDY